MIEYMGTILKAYHLQLQSLDEVTRVLYTVEPKNPLQTNKEYMLSLGGFVE